MPSGLQEGGAFELGVPDLDGKMVRIADFRGEVVLVDVWATWCAPCERSFPFYASLVRELGPDGFRVVAVSVDERVEDVRAWLETRELPFTVLHDPEGSIPQRIGLRTMPSAVLLDREGRVAGAHAGFDEAETAEIEAMIRSALDETP